MISRWKRDLCDGEFEDLVRLYLKEDFELVKDYEWNTGTIIILSPIREFWNEKLYIKVNNNLKNINPLGSVDLILLESSALIEQWKDALNKFLIIDEELPQYKTKTGRLRTRKSLIGTLQGAHDSMTGIIDIAMAGSLCKKGEYHKLLNHYGLVLIDECHHCASETIANVLKEVKARYVYGVTATPKRGDGLEKINYMLIGPIRYSYTAKEKAMEQGIQHLVYPRFTRTVPPRGVINGKMHPNEAYDIIHKNDIRDEQIIEDIKNCVSAGRTPVVLSRYKDHSEKLYERLKDYADHVFLMTGNNSKKEHKKIFHKM